MVGTRNTKDKMSKQQTDFSVKDYRGKKNKRLNSPMEIEKTKYKNAVSALQIQLQEDGS